MRVLETDRLILRRLSLDDAPFILELLNEPSWLRFIGDRGVRTLEDARNYLRNGPMASYERNGFGLYLVERKDGGDPIGMCGLIKRDSLEDVDIGFAFFPRAWGKGYAYEAAAAVMAYGKSTLGIGCIVAITNNDNESSIKVLEKIGMRFERMIKMAENEPEIRLYGTPPAASS